MRVKVALFSLVTSVAVSASAEPEFPGAIKEAAGIPCTPTCLLCHTAIPGTLLNLKQPFGLTVLGHGVQPGHPESMHTVVARLREDKFDTDGDHKIDVDELAIDSNPSDPHPQADICGPLYGCGAHLAPALPPPRAPVPWWVAVALALTTFGLARRRRSAQ